jgi:hypothetical protein
MNAVDWAKEFMRATKGSVNEEDMIGWFSNAIMCGWDHHYWSTDEYKQTVKNAINETSN